jgi:folate-binding protein YgfZ
MSGSGMHMQHQNLPLRHLAVLEFKGRDAGEFLQAQLTADILSMENSEGVFACCCNPAGRVLGLLLLKYSGASWFAICSAELAPVLCDWLGRYVLRSRVEIIMRDDLGVAAVPHAVSKSPATILFQTPQGCYAIMPLPELSGEDRADHRAAIRCNELLAGVFWLDEASSGQFLPQMLGLERIGALSFSKGCYPGQEIIARTRYLGKLKRHPVLCLVDGATKTEPLAAVELRQGEDFTASAVAVESAAVPHDAVTLLLLVMRAEPDFAPQTLVLDGKELTVRWSGTPGAETRLP